MKKWVGGMAALLVLIGAMTVVALTDGYEIKEQYTNIVGGLIAEDRATANEGDYKPLTMDTGWRLRVIDDRTGANPVTRLAITTDQEAVVPSSTALSVMALYGIAITEAHATTPAAVTLNIMSGVVLTQSAVMIPVKLAASGSVVYWFSPTGIDARDGISIDMVTGTADVVIFTR